MEGSQDRWPNRPMPSPLHPRIRAWTLLPLLFALAAAAAESTVGLRQKLWTVDDGLPNNNVNSLALTEDGYLWVGTINGLARFDGQRFEVFDVRRVPDFSTSDIVSFLPTRRNGLLFLARTGLWIQRKDDGSFVPRFDLVNIAAWMEDDSGRDWVVRDGGRLQEILPGGFGPAAPGPTIGGRPVFASGRAGPTVFRDGRWSELRDGAWADVDDLPALPDHRNSWQAQRKSSGSWFMLDQAVCRIVDGKSPLLTLRQTGVTDQVSMLAECPNGDACVTVYGGRAFVLDGKTGKAEAVRDPDGNRIIDASSMLMDNDGNLWIGTYSRGLIRLSPNPFTTRGAADGFPSEHLTTVAPRRGGGLWLGSREGLVWSWDGREAARVREQKPGSTVISLHEDRSGTLWIGQELPGVQRKTDGRHEMGWTPDGLGPREVEWPACFLESGAGDFWIGAANRVLQRRGAEWTSHRHADGLVESGFLCLTEDTRGRIWGGSYTGLNMLENGHWSAWHHGTNTLPYGAYSLLADPDGSVWIGTKGNQLNRIRDGRILGFPLNEDPADNAVCGMVADDLGNLWLATLKGILRVRRDAFEDCVAGRQRHLDADRFGLEDGLSGRESHGPVQPAIIRDADGRIHCATLRGLVSFRPSEVETRLEPAIVHIEEVQLDRRPVVVVPGRPVEVPAGTDQIQVRYTGVQLSQPEKLRFRYRLEGVDPEWVESDRRRSAFYPRLRPGNHTLRVQAVGPDRVWHEARHPLVLRVDSYFWETRTFTAAATAGGILVVAWIVRLISTRRFALRLAAVEKQAAVERERARISRDMHDDLGARLTKIAFFSELADRHQGTPTAMEHLQSVARMSREAARALNEMVWAVKPSNDTLSNLAGYLCQYATEYLEETPMRLRLDLPVSVPPQPVAAETRHQVFLVVKEALNNVVKHAEATEVLLRLVHGPRTCTITVADNGRGLPPEPERRTGNGLGNMARRVEQLGGGFRIGPREGGGTEVVIRVPIGIA